MIVRFATHQCKHLTIDASISQHMWQGPLQDEDRITEKTKLRARAMESQKVQSWLSLILGNLMVHLQSRSSRQFSPRGMKMRVPESILPAGEAPPRTRTLPLTTMLILSCKLFRFSLGPLFTFYSNQLVFVFRLATGTTILTFFSWLRLEIPGEIAR